MVLVAGEGLFNRQLSEEGHVAVDPHIWLAPPLAVKEVQRITTELIKLDPIHQRDYQTRSQQLQAKLGQLDQEYRQGLSRCQQQQIITAHSAFGYLADSYGLEQVAITGLSPEEEPSLKELADLAQLAKEKQIRYIFF